MSDFVMKPRNEIEERLQAEGFRVHQEPNCYHVAYNVNGKRIHISLNIDDCWTACYKDSESARKNLDKTNLTNKNIADLMRSVNGGEAETIRSELKEQLRVGMEILTEIINQWNDACADGDRGRGNDALGLIVYDDGSGRVVTYSKFSGEDYLNDQIQFDDIADGVEKLADWF